MHRQILNAPAYMLVDHINGNGLDNRKANLRLATGVQNGYNRRKTRKRTWSKYKGVTFDKRRKKWQAKIVVNGRKQYLGSFNNQLDGARAYDRAARKYHGEFAALNFADEPPQ